MVKLKGTLRVMNVEYNDDLGQERCDGDGEVQSVLNVEMLSSPKQKMTGLLMWAWKAEGKCGKETAMISRHWAKDWKSQKIFWLEQVWKRNV